jgi:tetratricopeptide (TPR) repeat protein
MLHDPDRSVPPIDHDPQDRMYAAESLLQADMSLAGERIAQSAEELLNSSLAWFAASRRSPATKRRAVAEVRRTMLPLVARALASSDQVPRAARLLDWADDDSYETKIARGVVAAAARDLPAARTWFERARLQAPSIADADQELGRALLDAGDHDGAVASFRRANALAPNWADPLKGWADALVAQRRYAEANEQYAAAARSAPRWGALQIEWGRSLWLAGRRAEGLAKLREATRLQLSAADQVSADFSIGVALRAMAAPSPQRPQ